jgi:hypothetical protein
MGWQTEAIDRDALLLQCAAFAGKEPAASYLEVRRGCARALPVRDHR